ncbi:hypothetical protein CDAR_3491 [Caerostris darwini]|uniref:Uncharacterized protein n=1 Tax=Caerostris darwini TaxID=1538125 RepID=A0AAV4QUK1_9ARAC|nr:hypothetical protein CDAR_3491 [Caerostris darwini]
MAASSTRNEVNPNERRPRNSKTSRPATTTGGDYCRDFVYERGNLFGLDPLEELFGWIVNCFCCRSKTIQRLSQRSQTFFLEICICVFKGNTFARRFVGCQK